MIDFSDIVITLEEEEIHSQLYRHHFPKYMHMRDKHCVAHIGHDLVLTFRAYCGKQGIVRTFDPDRFKQVSSFHKVTLVPGYTERYINQTEDFEKVTCPTCKADYPLALLGAA